MERYEKMFVRKSDMSQLDFVDPKTGRSEIFGCTIADYEARYGVGNVEIMDAQMVSDLQRAKFIKEASEIDADRFDQLLNVLPPNKWRNVDGWESFMMSEHDYGDLTTICVRVVTGPRRQSRYFSLTDSCRLGTDEIRAKVLAKFPELSC